MDFHLIPFHGFDLVLGIQWLRTLGPTIFDYEKLYMSFHHGPNRVTLPGLREGNPGQISIAQLSHEIHQGGINHLYRLELNSIDPENPASSSPDTEPPFQEAIAEILQRYSDVFDKPTGLPPARNSDHHIPLIPYTKPVNVHPYRYPHYHKAEIEKLVQEMLDEGVIRPSQSPFSSPILLVRKKDGSCCFCIDYRALNAVTVKDRYPIPTIEELFDELSNATLFSKLDLRTGYHQLRVHMPDIPKTAFRTSNGHFEFLVMPFGLTNAPSSFQALMNSVFCTYLRKIVLVFFDDILVYNNSSAQHIIHL